MINIAICDNEKVMRTYLSSLVKRQNIECSITEYASAAAYLSDAKEYDVLFSDIEMHGASSDIDGMSMAKQIRSMELKRQPIIIFVTDYEKYVYDAFDVDAFQYLLKPLDEVKFSEVFQRAVKRISEKNQVQKKVLVVQSANVGKAVPLENIYYVESASHKVVLHMKDGELEYYAKMGDLEHELQGQFYRIHKGYLVNLACVGEYSKTDVTILNGDKLLLSKYKYSGFVKAYLEYIQKDKEL